jgi:hypothetical protein
MDKGRKTKYNDSFPARALKLTKKGLSHREISEKLGISKMTFYQYRNEYPEFADALKND